MTHSIKDLLIKVLDTKGRPMNHNYDLKASLADTDVPPESVLAWRIQLFPRCMVITDVGKIISLVNRIYPSVLIDIYMGDDGYLSLF